MKMTKGVSIARVSDISQKENTSLEGQHNINVRECLRRGISIIEFFSEQKSGRGIRQTVEDAYEFCRRHNAGKSRSKQIEYLIVQVWDRWFRNSDLAGYWNYRFSEIGVQVNAAQQWRDRKDSASIIFTSLHQGMAEAESLKNSERTRRGIYETIRAGRLPSTPPRGYLLSKELDEQGKRKVVHDPERAEQYRQAFALVASGVKPVQVYRQFGGRQVFGARQTFYDALRNTVYAGRKRHQAPFENMPDLDVVLNFQPIVDWLTFQKVQRVLSQNNAGQRRVDIDEKFFARSVLRCPHCAGVMTSETSKGRSKKYHYYRCATHHKHYRVSRENLHRFIIDRLIPQLRLSPAGMEYAIEQAENRVQAIRTGISTTIGQLRRNLDQAQDRQGRALTLYVDEKISSEEYQTYRDQVDELSSEIVRQEYVRDNQGQLMKKVLLFLGSIHLIYRELPGIDRMAMLQMMFPDGFYLDNRKPAHMLEICRTARINNIFAITGDKTASYEAIKIESPADLPGFPVKGGRPDHNRTAQIAQDFKAFELFALRLSA